MRPREPGEGQDLGLGRIHQGSDLDDPVGELVADRVPGAAHGVGVGLSKDRAEHGCDHVHLGFRDQGEEVAGEVDPAALMGRALETAHDRRGQASVLIRDDQPDPVQAAALQRGEEPAPEHFVLTVPDVKAEDLPAPIAGDSGRDHDRFGGDQMVAADVEVRRVEKHVGVLDGVESSGAETADLLVELPADPRYLRLRDPRSAQRFDQRVDVAGRHPTDPGFHHHGIQGLIDPAPRLEHGGEERSLPQLRNRHLHVAAFGQQGPRSGTVAFGDTVGGPFVAGGADHLCGFGFDQFLEHEPHGLAHQIDAVAGAERLEQFGHGRLGQGHRCELLHGGSWRYNRGSRRWPPPSAQDTPSLKPHHSTGLTRSARDP